ncbi:Two-component response regulator ORR26 [Camellia lanceoleosa]|uniref:Two-component response regulator ORR26 n=1 Tax=Camellia lanceoleosa TaxID=1840588 RepID=A0ACC0IDV1_9ERIC|nr:Two-component response regulator ORR26 [Camellia lanceoleosa]
MESGFCSARTDAFPAGLRVLVVDDDLVWLRILEKMLKKCSYEVTTCCLAREALDLLRERKDGFDIVISDVNMPDMDGFKLLEHVGLEMDLPVIMMSVDGETSRVMRGVQHGACDYLLKPIRMKELRNIWQHVFRKKIHEVRDIENLDCFEEIQMMRYGTDQSDDGHLFSGGDLTSGKKRKDVENKGDDKDFSDASSAKKARVVWTVDLHQKFVKSVNQIGFDKVGPKKILDLMNVPWLTRENVASHLQKYRLYLGRLQKENELKAFMGGIKQSDLSSKDPVGSLGLQNSIDMQQNDVASGIYGVPGSKIHVQNVDPKIHEGDLKGIVSLPLAEPKKAPIRDIPDPPKTSSSRVELNHSFRPLEPDIKYIPFDSTIPTQYSWSEVSKIQFKQEHKAHLQSEQGFNHLPLPPSISPRPFNKEREKSACVEVKPTYANCKSQQIRQAGPTRSAADLFPVQSESHMTSFHTEPIATTTLSLKHQGLNQIFINDLESAQKNLILGSCSCFGSLDEDGLACLLQGDCYTTMNVGIENRESVPFAETPAYLFDAHRFDHEYPWEPMEYPVIDQGLFIV